MRTFIVGIVGFAALAASADAALVCASAPEMKVLQSAALQQQLMVAALSCHLSADYNAFVTAYRERLVQSDQALKAFFASRPRGEDYNVYKTRIANTVSRRSLHDARFCDSAHKVFDMALGRGAERNGLAPEPPQLVDTGYEGCRPVDDNKLIEAKAIPRPLPRPQAKVAVAPKPSPEKPSGAPVRVVALSLAKPAPVPKPVVTPEAAHALALADHPVMKVAVIVPKLAPTPPAATPSRPATPRMAALIRPAPAPLTLRNARRVTPDEDPSLYPQPSHATADEDASLYPPSRVSADEDPSRYPQPSHATADEDPSRYPPSRVSADEDPSLYPQPSHATAEEDPRRYPPSRVSADEDPSLYPQPSHATADEDPSRYPPSRVSADEDPSRYPQPSHATADEDPSRYPPSRVSEDEDPSLYPQPSYPTADEPPDRDAASAPGRYAAIERPRWGQPTNDDQFTDDRIPNAYRPGARWVRDAGPGWHPIPPDWQPANYDLPPHGRHRHRPILVRAPDGHWVVVIGHQSRWVRE